MHILMNNSCLGQSMEFEYLQKKLQWWSRQPWVPGEAVFQGETAPTFSASHPETATVTHVEETHTEPGKNFWADSVIGTQRNSTLKTCGKFDGKFDRLTQWHASYRGREPLRGRGLKMCTQACNIHVVPINVLRIFSYSKFWCLTFFYNKNWRS